MRYKKTVPQLLSEAAEALAGSEHEITRLKKELFEIREKVNFFFFGPPEHIASVRLGGIYPEMSLIDQLKEKALELEPKEDK